MNSAQSLPEPSLLQRAVAAYRVNDLGGGFDGGSPIPLAGPNLGVLAAGAIGLAISHGFSFWTNYLGRGEYRTLSPSQVMIQPYGRLVIMHLTILLGAFVSIFLGTPVGSLLVRVETS